MLTSKVGGQVFISLAGVVHISQMTFGKGDGQSLAGREGLTELTLDCAGHGQQHGEDSTQILAVLFICTTQQSREGPKTRRAKEDCSSQGPFVWEKLKSCQTSLRNRKWKECCGKAVELKRCRK